MATDHLLDGLHQRFRETLKSGQPQAFKGLYSESATVLPPNRPALVGLEAIGRFWQRARNIQDVAFEPIGSERLGDDVLRETGTLRLVLKGQGREQDPMTREATYLLLWRRADGDWRLDTLMWRPNNAEGANRRGGGAGQRPNGRLGGPAGDGPGRRRQQGADGPNRGNRTEDGGRGNQVQGFGPRARRNRVDQQAPMIPVID